MNDPIPSPALTTHRAESDRAAHRARPVSSALVQGVGVRLAVAAFAAALLWATVGWALS